MLVTPSSGAACGRQNRNLINDKAEKSWGKESTAMWDRPRGMRWRTPAHNSPSPPPLRCPESSIWAVERKTQRVWPAE